MATTETKKDVRVGIWVKTSPDVRNLFKSCCAKRGKTMNQMFVRFMKNTISGKIEKQE